MRGSKDISQTGLGLPVGISQWRTVRQLRRCFTLTGHIKFPSGFLCCALTARDCLLARRSPGRLRRRGGSGPTFRWERQTATKAMRARCRDLQVPRIAPSCWSNRLENAERVNPGPLDITLRPLQSAWRALFFRFLKRSLLLPPFRLVRSERKRWFSILKHEKHS